MRGSFVRVLGAGALGIAVGCSDGGDADGGGECEQTPTCDSALVIALEDARTDFGLTVSDAVGMDIVVQCPIDEEGTEQFGDYSVICGAGRLTISTFLYFGDEVEVQLNAAEPKIWTPDYQKGIDYCGNTCTTGTIQL